MASWLVRQSAAKALQLKWKLRNASLRCQSFQSLPQLQVLAPIYDFTHTNSCSPLQQQEQQIVYQRILLLCRTAESSKSAINLCIHAAEPQNDAKPIELQAGDAASAPAKAEEAAPAAVEVVRRQRILPREEWP